MKTSGLVLSVLLAAGLLLFRPVLGRSADENRCVTCHTSEAALKALDSAVTALRSHLGRREVDIDELEKDTAETREEIARLSEVLGKLESEIERVGKSIGQTETNIQRADENLASFEDLLTKEKTEVDLYGEKEVELGHREN